MVSCKKILVLLLFLLLGGTPVFAASILYDWAFNLDGTTYENFAGETLPATVDSTAFDWYSGLGTLSISFVAASDMDYSLIAFFDHEIDESVNTYFNESGTVSGTAAAGQSWEIDEPGWVYGDIYLNVLDGMLDNSNGVPAGFEDDVSMALGWDLSLLAGDSVLIEFILGEVAPTGGFYLTHTDPDSEESIYFSSTATVAPVPEPGTILLLGAGLVGLLAGRKYLT